MKKLDWYILKKFIGTFFFSVGLISIMIVVFDISEKWDNFYKHHIPLSKIIMEHYVNFVPFLVNALSPLFIFISVILFTSRMASRYETVAILSSGVSYARFLRPYMIGAGFFCLMSLVLSHFIIPKGNRIKQEFEDRYINDTYTYNDEYVDRNFSPGFKMELQRFDVSKNRATNFSMEKYDGQKMIYFFSTPSITWDSLKRSWKTEDWYERYPGKSKDSIAFGPPKELKIDFSPTDMARQESREEVMTYFELKEFLAKEKKKGTPGLERFEVVNYKRTSVPIASFILTLIGVAIAARKTRGGIGMHIAIGLLLGASYVVFLHFSSIFARTQSIPPLVAVWIPNVVYAIIAFFLIRGAQK